MVISETITFTSEYTQQTKWSLRPVIFSDRHLLWHSECTDQIKILANAFLIACASDTPFCGPEWRLTALANGFFPHPHIGNLLLPPLFQPLTTLLLPHFRYIWFVCAQSKSTKGWIQQFKWDWVFGSILFFSDQSNGPKHLIWKAIFVMTRLFFFGNWFNRTGVALDQIVFIFLYI